MSAPAAVLAAWEVFVGMSESLRAAVAVTAPDGTKRYVPATIDSRAMPLAVAGLVEEEWIARFQGRIGELGRQMKFNGGPPFAGRSRVVMRDEGALHVVRIQVAHGDQEFGWAP